MIKTPKANRLHIGIFGKRNAGKSSLLNRLTNQDVSIVSPVAGTTTDAVEKTMEFLPLGPVVFIDTAGVDDEGSLGNQRIEKTKKIFDRTDIALIISDYNGWDNYEKELYNEFKRRQIPIVTVINKIDEARPPQNVIDDIKKYTENLILTSTKKDEDIVNKVKKLLVENVPDYFINPPSILGDIVAPKSTVMLVIPIDKEAPKGRIILPQVQCIRDLLDNDCMPYVVKVSELAQATANLKVPPSLVVTDSQAFKEVDEIVDKSIPLTSFSIVFARIKGDLQTFYEGARTIDELQEGDNVLICESCSHHPIEDDIARVKIPRWIKNKTGKDMNYSFHSSHDFVNDLDKYKLIIHCGACMTNRREILSRIMKAKEANVAITNYGIAIAHCLGILPRAMKPFS